jgi:hypothetical protein
VSEQVQDSRVVLPNNAPPLDFISSADLRQSLESDYSELVQALSARMWKSACILAGSIAEAVLIDYVAVLGNCSASDEELTAPDMSLGKLIDAAIGIDALASSQPPTAGWSLPELIKKGTDTRAVSSFRTTYDMSSAVKNFRNLIHPGRSLRLKEHVDGSVAVAARAFVDRLLRDLRQESTERYPYVADDLLAKALKDTTGQTILTDMLRRTRPAEIQRLLADVAPSAFLKDWCDLWSWLTDVNGKQSSWDEVYYHVLEDNRKAAARAYRLAFDYGNQAQRSAGLHSIAGLLKKEESSAIVALETEFLKTSDLAYAADDDRIFIVGDILDRTCAGNAGKDLLDSAAGIGHWIPPERAAEFAKALLDKKCRPKVEDSIRSAALKLLELEYQNMSGETQKAVFSAAGEYQDTICSRPGYQADTKAIEELLEYWNMAPWLQELEDENYPG